LTQYCLELDNMNLRGCECFDGHGYDDILCHASHRKYSPHLTENLVQQNVVAASFCLAADKSLLRRPERGLLYRKIERVDFGSSLLDVHLQVIDLLYVASREEAKVSFNDAEAYENLLKPDIIAPSETP
jgi:hypothetical protein